MGDNKKRRKVDKKEYDRQHSKRIYEQYKKDRKEILNMFGNCCELCGSVKNLHLHHKYYDKNSNYPKTSNGWSRIKRVKEAKTEPDKFALLCNSCHASVHNAIENKDKLLKLLALYSPSSDDDL